ncbi:hypothetical protein CIB95_15480 [Lottiidibacillus patelloidae]|uniref:Uncharacterized protein n=1 Tax=Lottiidibacillus patelloidae TaxID=2670334 RepID=A0A263BQA3_9BACI|nr:hypothetical protein [Lottiidibacillus patelloidae]OZM55762.1 hypothetical protein CIB95_15480 [Lottiidibacillus patelloidae]
MGEREDIISLSVPLEEEYETVIRLTVSGIAAQMGYTYKSIEDIKNSISEVYRQSLLKVKEEDWIFSAMFHVKLSALIAELVVKNKTKSIDCDEYDVNEFFSLEHVKSLMDSVNILKHDDSMKVVIKKLLYNSKEKKIEQESSAL